MMWVAPAVYWWTGVSVIRASVDELARWFLPAMAANLLFMSFYAGNRVLPVMTDVSQLLSATTILRTVAHGLVRPFGRSFRVTAKGISNDRVTVHWSLLWPFAAIALMTAGGVILHLSSFSPERGSPGFALNMIWSVVAVTVMSLTAFACVEQPRRRAHERFDTDEEALIVMPDGTECHCTLREISLGGGQIERPQQWPSHTQEGLLVCDYGRVSVPFRVVRHIGSRIAVQFVVTTAIQRALMLKLYTGRYNKEIENVRMTANMRSLARTLTSF